MKKLVERKEKDRFTVDDAFPNHIHLQSCNFGVDIGSFNLGVIELADIALRCMQAMKDMEEEKQ